MDAIVHHSTPTITTVMHTAWLITHARRCMICMVYWAPWWTAVGHTAQTDAWDLQTGGTQSGIGHTRGVQYGWCCWCHDTIWHTAKQWMRQTLISHEEVEGNDTNINERVIIMMEQLFTQYHSNHTNMGLWYHMSDTWRDRANIF